MAIAPITGMIRRRIVLDLSIAGAIGLASGTYWWYGYHMPTVRHRDAFYVNIENERAAKLKALSES